MSNSREVPVTVISAVYNTAQFLRETVESVAAQTLLPKEHLLIDDCSTDGSLALARELEREFSHVRVIAHEENRGYPAALNTGIAASYTKYIAILDSDDIALPHWLETVVPVLEADPQIGAAGGGCVIMTESGKITGHIIFCAHKGDVTEGIKRGEYLILHPGTIHRRSCLAEIGGYNPQLKSGEDNDVFLGISSIAKLVNVGAPLIYYRRLRRSESRKTDEFTAIRNKYLKSKAELLNAGYTVADANRQLADQIETLIKLPRLSSVTDGMYEFEMANAFENGGHRLHASRSYLISAWCGYKRGPTLRAGIRCLIPQPFIRLWRRLR